LLDGWVVHLADESLRCIGRQLKLMMKQVIAVVEKGIEVVEEIEFCIYGH
jgi:hypothetical protein